MAADVFAAQECRTDKKRPEVTLPEGGLDLIMPARADLDLVVGPNLVVIMERRPELPPQPLKELVLLVGFVVSVGDEETDLPALAGQRRAARRHGPRRDQGALLHDAGQVGGAGAREV